MRTRTRFHIIAMIENSKNSININNEDLLHGVFTYNDNTECDTELGHLNPSNEESKGSNNFFLYFCAIIVCGVSSLKFGLIVVWISPVAKQLLSDDPNVNPLGAPISTLHLSCISAIPGASSMVGSLVLGKMFDVYGRKRAMIMMSLPVLLLEICIAFATDIMMIYIPLLISSFILGGLLVGGRVYLTEISEDHLRSKIVCIGVLGIPLGNLCSFLIASCDPSFRMFTLACIIPFMVSVGCLMIFLTESPIYLVARNKPEEALAALGKLRNKSSEGLHKELEVISYILEKTSESKAIGLTSLFSEIATRRAFILSLVIHLITFFNGGPGIMTHLIYIFDESSSSIPNYISNNSLTFVQLLFSFMATQISERFGRKSLLLASTSCNALSLFSVAVYFHLKSVGFSYIGYISWWPLVALIIFYISNSLGLNSVCWIFSSEVFPNNALSTATSLLGSIDSLAASIGISSLPMIADVFGIHWNFWLYGVVCVLGYIFVYFKVPETRGKSLIEIQAILKK